MVAYRQDRVPNWIFYVLRHVDRSDDRFLVAQVCFLSFLRFFLIQLINPFRKLRNPRNKLHMHLFASFIMRAFMTLVRDWIFVDGISRTVDVIYVENYAFIKQRNVGRVIK